MPNPISCLQTNYKMILLASVNSWMALKLQAVLELEECLYICYISAVERLFTFPNCTEKLHKDTKLEK